jgi:glycosyltransferase involved in cell wall biosynthesis
MVEAMACGLPVAAYPVAGPIDVVGASGAGSLKDDLREACIDCLSIPRLRAIQRSKEFTWERATEQFAGALVPMRTELSREPSPLALQR